ncbi:uncharacterized protein LOC100180471 [Ciona intestinalis]
MAAKTGPVGGAATLSSFRVQKAFSINFRENMRLLTEIKLIENDHIRNIRQVKQDIKVTRIWLDNIRESTGYSQHGLRPDSATDNSSKIGRKRGKKTPQRSETVDPSKLKHDVIIQLETSDDDDVTKHSGKDQMAHVRFAWQDKTNEKPEKVIRPSTIATTAEFPATGGARSHMKSEPADIPTSHTQDNTSKERNNEENESGSRKQRAHSATSGRSSQASLTTYQRRRRLQGMMVRKRNPLEIKKEMNEKDGVRVEGKVREYLAGLADRMKIELPQLTPWGVDLE